MPFPTGVTPVELPDRATHGGPIAVLADIHGNSLALEAVIADATSLGVEQWVILGDVVAMGADPSEVLSRLHDLQPIAAIRGNTDRYVIQGSQPEPSLTEMMANPSCMSQLISSAESFAWTRGHLTATGTIHMLDRYVPAARFKLPDGTRVLAVHASLRSDEGRGISPDVTEPEMAHLIPDPSADLVIGGHTHRQCDTMFGLTRYFNPGSVSNAPTRTNTASYTIIHADTASYRTEPRSVAYDIQEAANRILRSGMPGAAALVQRYFVDNTMTRASRQPEVVLV